VDHSALLLNRFQAVKLITPVSLVLRLGDSFVLLLSILVRLKNVIVLDSKILISYGVDDEALNLLHHTYFFQEVALILQTRTEIAF
jgi:hypothetical protein